jgi:hypothetical protein
MNLTENFTLAEMTSSLTAERMGRPIVATGRVIRCLECLCEDVLQPARDFLRDELDEPVMIIVNSGYRPYWLNRWIGGSKTSSHMCGERTGLMEAAADIRIIGTKASLLSCAQILAGADNVDYDQLIYEGTWIHISWRAEEPRRQILTAKFSRNLWGKRKTTYHRGLLA